MKKKDHFIYGDIIRPIIFGINDGTVSTLALVASLVGASLANRIIIIGGLAEMITGAISMALGEYISSKSKVEYYKGEMNKEENEINKKSKGEISELKEIYKRRGFKGKELNILIKIFTSNKDRWKKLKCEEELGLLKTKFDNPKKVGFVMGIAFTLSALIPVIPFFFFEAKTSLVVSIVLCSLVLFSVGVIKTRFSNRIWYKSGLEMVLIGLIATFIGYYLGEFFSNIL